MKAQYLGLIAAAGLLVGCAETRKHAGSAAMNDQNVLTGGPVTGTTLNDLPQAVRATLQRRAPNAEVADIDQTNRDGRVVYQISFTEPGRNPQIYVDQNGQLLSSPDLSR